MSCSDDFDVKSSSSTEPLPFVVGSDVRNERSDSSSTELWVDCVWCAYLSMGVVLLRGLVFWGHTWNLMPGRPSLPSRHPLLSSNPTHFHLHSLCLLCRSSDDVETDSDDEDDFMTFKCGSGPRQIIPQWAKGEELQARIWSQFSEASDAFVDPSTIFGYVNTCNLDDIFHSHGSSTRLRRERRSTGRWSVDKLTQGELDDYREAMGYSSSPCALHDAQNKKFSSTYWNTAPSYMSKVSSACYTSMERHIMHGILYSERCTYPHDIYYDHQSDRR